MDEKSLQNTTNLQKIASNPQNSAWVFASAGSGKTKILVDRVLRLLLQKVAANKILCVTFTKIASIEMQERINKVLASWVVIDDEKLRENIFELTGNMPNAQDLNFARILFAKGLDEDSRVKIQTIHAFCQNLVNIFPFEMEVAPNFEVLDESLEKLLLQKAKKEIFLLAKFDIELQKIIAEINSRLSEEAFIDLISDILNQKEKLIFLKIKFLNIENLIAKIFEKFGVIEFESEEEIFEDFVAKLDFSRLRAFIEKTEKGRAKTDQRTAFLFKNFIEHKTLQNVSFLDEIFYTKSGDKRAKIVTKEFEDEADFVDEIAVLVDNFFDLLNSYKIAKSSEFLLQFVDKILQKYCEIKAQNSFLDYNDLIIKTNELLENEEFSDWVKFRMDGFFDHILIDESQDTNHHQWAIIKALSDDFFSGISASNQERSLFIIGDDKQSIYSFQGAKPNISHEIFDFYKEKTFDSKYEIKKVELQNSFRSLPKILKFVDNIFAQNESFKKIDYKPHSAIRQGEGVVEIWPRIESQKKEKETSFEWKNYATDENFEDEEFCQKEEMANRIADKILTWIDEKKQLTGLGNKGENCQIDFCDIMILLRNRANGFDKILQRIFDEKSIPFKGVKKVKFSDEIIIQDLLSAAKFVLLQDDDLNLACLLKSPIFSFSEEKLLEVCLIKNEKEISLNEALKLAGQSFEQDVEKLEEVILESQNISSYDFFANLIDEDLRKKFAAEFGENAFLVIDKFMLEVADFCAKNLPNLQKFLEYVDKINPSISLIDPSSNCVLISTIHSAKGLQAPIVILPDCCFSFNKMQAAKENLLWINFSDEVFGDAELPIWLVRKNEANSIVKKAKENRLKELKDEYWRLFYVALTRAENELYISGFGGDNDEDSWYNLAQIAI